MKKQIFCMALAAIMTIGSIVFASCDKTEDIMSQNQASANTDTKYTKDTPAPTPEAWFIITRTTVAREGFRYVPKREQSLPED